MRTNGNQTHYLFLLQSLPCCSPLRKAKIHLARQQAVAARGVALSVFNLRVRSRVREPRAVPRLIDGASAPGGWSHPPSGLLDVTIQQERSRKWTWDPL